MLIQFLDFMVGLVRPILKIPTCCKTLNLNIYNYCHIHRKVNKTRDCLARKGNCNTNFNIWPIDFLREVRKAAFEDYYE